MNSILMLKWVGGSLLLGSSSIIAIVATVDPFSAGATVAENIKPEEEINFYATLTAENTDTKTNTPPKITKSSTNFQCKLSVDNKTTKNIDPFYCEIYKWNNANNKKENHYEFNKLADYFTLPHDSGDQAVDWIRVKFNKKHFNPETHSGGNVQVQIMPHYQDPSVVINSKTIFKVVDKKAKNTEITKFLVKADSTKSITGDLTNLKCKLGEKDEEKCKIYEFNKSESPLKADNSYSNVVFEKVDLQKTIANPPADPPADPEYSITQHKHYIVDFHEQKSGAKTEDEYKNKKITYPSSTTPPGQAQENITILKPVIISKIAGTERLIVL